MATPPHSCVVIHSASEDEHGKAVSLNLKAKGIPFILLAQDRCFCDWSIEDRHGEVVIRSEDRVLSTEDIGIVYWRQDYQCTSDTVFARCGGDAGIAAFIAEQRERHVYGCWNTLQRYVPFMNGLDANRRAQSKIYQQHMASQIGLRVPLTYTGAQPKEAEAFAQQLWEQGKRCCTKNIESTRIVINGKPHARYTQLFTPADVCQLDALSACPMIFQEYAEKKWEYRVTVVGDTERVNDFETPAEQIYCRAVAPVFGPAADSRAG